MHPFERVGSLWKKQKKQKKIDLLQTMEKEMSCDIQLKSRLRLRR